MLESDYEALRRLGYTEEEISVSLEGLSGLGIFPSPLGSNREDKGVTISPKGNQEKRTSNIMMGYNKEGITLKDGEYVELSEFIEALEASLKEDFENKKIIQKKTGKQVDFSEAIEGIVRDAIVGSTIGIESDYIFDNQNSVSVQINDKSGKIFDKGSFMLGQIEMPNGEYVYVGDIQAALSGYILMEGPEVIVPPIIPVPDEPNVPLPEEPIKEEPKPEPTKEPQKEEKHKVIKRFLKKMNHIPLIVGLGAYLMSGLSLTQQQQIIYENIDNLDYGIVEMVESTHHVYESDEDILERVRSQIKVGEEATVEAGTRYYASSDHEYGGDNTYGTFGSVLRPEGQYTVDRISVLHNEKIYEVEAEPGKDVATILTEFAQELGVDVSELEAEASLVGPVSGWVAIDNLNKDMDRTPQVKETKVVMTESSLIKGGIDGFEGDTITVDGATVTIKDAEGNLIKPGSVVKASDGREFRVASLNMEEQTLEHVEDMGKKLTWSLQDCREELLLICALSAFMTKKKKEIVELTDSELEAIIEAKKEEYDKESEFKKAIETLTTKKVELGKTPEELAKQALIDHETTLEELDKMGGMRL